MPAATCLVEFYDYNGAFLGQCRVFRGQAAPYPAMPRPPKGWRFDCWEPQVCYVTENTRTQAVYIPKEYLVTFVSETGAVLKREYVPHGHDAAPPQYVSKTKDHPVIWNGRTQNIQRPQVFRAVFAEQLA
ncbi:MAG: hypothetical protein LBB50_06390 [Oscillospiraceae bacterium]|jgi:hypothetical protein|nr:hypothetical protein [Oscillospiraceae bacterium]